MSWAVAPWAWVRGHGFARLASSSGRLLEIDWGDATWIEAPRIVFLSGERIKSEGRLIIASEAACPRVESAWE